MGIHRLYVVRLGVEVAIHPKGEGRPKPSFIKCAGTHHSSHSGEASKHSHRIWEHWGPRSKHSRSVGNHSPPIGGISVGGESGNSTRRKASAFLH